MTRSHVDTKSIAQFFIALCLLTCTCACLSNTANVVSHKLLFIGNSLTYTNNLPQLVADVSKKNGTPITYKMVAFPNYALEDHWNDGLIQKLIGSKEYDYVIVQQGPSSQADGKEMLLEYGAKIKGLCDGSNAQLAFFMVWPSKANYHTFDGVIANHTLAAEQTKSLLCPVGKVWKEHFDKENDFSYYGPDNFHPSPEGSQVAAQVIYDVLFRSN